MHDTPRGLYYSLYCIGVALSLYFRVIRYLYYYMSARTPHPRRLAVARSFAFGARKVCIRVFKAVL